ncbi:hypothetical protein AAVH_27713 [Aphelenchoides avenae]|nr:hypothetical protein AAVH_27713 [Aphelenchus avenae]
MSKQEKLSFMEWYDAHRNEPFDLCESLAEYCSNDTLILIYALVNFRQMFNEVAGCSDIFIRCCTITGGCIRLFRHRFLKEKSLAVVPNNGYLGGEVQSGKALKFIKWFAQKHNVKVQHRDTDEGEYRTLNTRKSYRLDGYIPLAERLKPEFSPCNQPGCAYCEDPESLQKDIALEFHGCAWHGCPECFPNEARLPNGKKSDEAYADTEKRINGLINAGLKVLQVWEHTVDKELKEDKELKKWFDNEHDTRPLDPREAFFGGHKHCDVVSLYPSVLRMPYPVGHPEVHHFGWSEGAVLWERPNQVEYQGLTKCMVSPPKSLFLPLLPFRDDQRLLFPLCRTCATESRKESCYGLKQCTHTDEQREFVTTTTHFKLEEALRRGYKVEASGWENVGIDPDDEDAKERFRVEYALREGILVNKDNVRLNKGMRYIAKLCLNSLWGRFAMRANREQAEITTSPNSLYELLDSPSKEVIKIVDMDEDTLRVSWRYKNRFERTDENSNLVVAIFTTAYGRCQLYKHMCAVDERMDGPAGSMLLYNDTDSVIYEYIPDPALPNGGNPLEEGMFLGQMTDEYKDAEILEFLSGGNKQYGLQYQRRGSERIDYTLKIRGITLTNERSRRLLSYKKFRQMICDQPLVMPLSLPNDLIMRDTRSNVFTLHSTKNYMPTFLKGHVDLSDPCLTIYPLGFVFPPNTVG